MANKQLIIDADLPVEQKVMGLIMCLAQENQADIARLLKPLGISFLQLNLLHALDYSQQDELTVKELKSALVEDSPNVSRALNKLVDKKLITKRRCNEDQRTVYVAITEQGKLIHKAGDKQLMNIQSTNSDVDHQLLFALLKRM